MLLSLLVASVVALTTAQNDYLNVGLVHKNKVDFPNVVAGGAPTDSRKWDPAPYSDLSNYKSPQVQFGVWITELATDGPETLDVNFNVSMKTPEASVPPTNYAKCSTPHFEPATGTIVKLQSSSVNASALRLTIDPQQGCTQPGQSQVYITITKKSTGEILSQISFVTTFGNPLDIGLTQGGKEIASQGIVADAWDPKHITDGTASDLYSVNSGKETINFFVRIPSSRKQPRQGGTNPLVLGDQEGVTLPGSITSNQITHCTTSKIEKACQALVQNIPTSPPANGGEWEDQPNADAGYDYSITISYQCKTNGYVDLQVDIPLESGFAPISFAWRKACQRSPGLAIATNVDAVLHTPDVASDGTIKPAWDINNVTKVDTAHKLAKSYVKQREFYFWVNPKVTNVEAAVFKRTNYTSTMHPNRGATSLVCQPTPMWQIASNYDPKTTQCTGEQNECNWKNLPAAKVANNAPVDPLQPGSAPIRVVFSYDECAGQGAVLLTFEITFGAFDLVRVGWYKYVGAPPGLTLSCVSGCPPSKNGSSDAPQPMIVNGVTQGVWGKTGGALLENRIIQSSWLLSADGDISDYDFQITQIEPHITSGNCAVQWIGELAKHFNKNGGQWIGELDFKPKTEVVVNLFYLCSPGSSSTTERMTFSFQNFAPVQIEFTKNAQYSKHISVGSGNSGPTDEEDVNSQGTIGPKWKSPETACLLKDGNPDRESGCVEDPRGTLSRDFYVSYRDDASEKQAIVPAPTKDGSAAKQYPGVHSTHFFSYNSSDMFGCNPFWDVEQKGKITNKADFIKQGKAILSIGGEPLKVTINYNCSIESSRCSKPGACAALFTGFIPVNANACGSDGPGIAPCMSPSFKWIKTVAPIQPTDADVQWIHGPIQPNGGNVTWTVPNSGDGEDLVFNQRIKNYNITVVDINSKERREYILPARKGNLYAAPINKKLLFSLWNMTGESYHLWFNVTNDAGLSFVSPLDPIFIQPGKSVVPDKPLSEEYIAVLAAGSGVLVVLAACCMYHCCIKADDDKSTTEQHLLLGVQASTLNESGRINEAQVQQQQQRLPEEDPYLPGEFTPTADDPQFSDADTMLKGLLAEN